MRILLATDFSAYADIARSLVKSMTLPPGSSIRIVHAVVPITTVAIFASPALLTINELAEREAKELVKQTESLVKAEGRQVDGVVGFGRAADVIADECADFKPDLLVVGSRGRGGIASAVLGSVSAELVDRAPCPVLVARTNRLHVIVLAEDGSASATAGAGAIVELPIFATCAVRVVSVVDARFPLVLADAGTTDTALDAFRAYESSLPELRASHAAMARERAAVLTRSGIKATWEQRDGNAADELLTAASQQHADCIVIGSRGQTGVQRLLLGSVARSVLFHAPCSVLIAHATPTAEKRSTDPSEHFAVRA